MISASPSLHPLKDQSLRETRYGSRLLPGNTADNTTLKDFLARIVAQYGEARRIWLMDRGVPTEAVLAEMRAADPPVQYLVGTPKGRLTPAGEGAWSTSPGTTPGRVVQVKLLPQGGELYVFAQSTDRVAKERAIRRRQLKCVVGTAQAVGRHEAQVAKSC